MTDDSVRHDPRSAGRRRDIVRGLVVAALAGIFLAMSGAYVRDDAPLASRLVYWLLLMLAGGLWGEVCARLLRRFIDIDERPWATVAILSVAIAAPLSVLVWAVTGPAFGGPVYPLRALPHLLIPVFSVTVALSAINIFLTRRPVQTHAAAGGATAARFTDRLPFKLRGAAIHAVQAEDHYLRIHTDRGSDLILMRLGDALDELEGLEGAQTHRSWWVARDAVAAVARGDGRATLTLTSGLVVPVSRRHARALRAAGWY